MTILIFWDLVKHNKFRLFVGLVVFIAGAALILISNDTGMVTAALLLQHIPWILGIIKSKKAEANKDKR